MSPFRSNALRKEDENMEAVAATPLTESTSHLRTQPLPKNRPTLEISAMTGPSMVQLIMPRILQYLSQGRNLGPLSVLIIAMVYSLLSSHLPPQVHDYIYHIAH